MRTPRRAKIRREPKWQKESTNASFPPPLADPHCYDDHFSSSSRRLRRANSGLPCRHTAAIRYHPRRLPWAGTPGGTVVAGKFERVAGGNKGACRREKCPDPSVAPSVPRSQEHTSELQSLMRSSYAVS